MNEGTIKTTTCSYCGDEFLKGHKCVLRNNDIQTHVTDEGRILRDQSRNPDRILLRDTLEEIEAEAIVGYDKWGAFNSAHEGWAVLREEVDEMWDHVKIGQRRRDLQAMRTEAIQVAAMALRFALEVCDERRGRK